MAEPALRQLEALCIPNSIFVNKIDQARGSIHDLLEALQPMSASPLIARQLPIRAKASGGEKVTGFVDLALERAFHYRPGTSSDRTEIPAALAEREAAERFPMHAQPAEHDTKPPAHLLMS